MKSDLKFLSALGAATLLIAGCQAQYKPGVTQAPLASTPPTPAASSPQVASASQAAPAVIDPINDPSLRDNNNDSGGGGGGGGGGNDSPGGGGGGSWN